MPDNLAIQNLMNNHATHLTNTICSWFARRPRWHTHFTPSSTSLLHQVERFSAELREERLRRGVHNSTSASELAILRYICMANDRPGAPE